MNKLLDGGFWAAIDAPLDGGSYLECNENNNLGASDYNGGQ